MDLIIKILFRCAENSVNVKNPPGHMHYTFHKDVVSIQEAYKVEFSKVTNN